MSKICIQPQGKTIEVARGDSIFQALIKAGVSIQADCGGGGTCGKCVARVTSGEAPIQAVEKNHLTDFELQNGYRLLCLLKAEGDLTIEVPEASRPMNGQILTVGQAAHTKGRLNPKVKQHCVLVSAPTSADPCCSLGMVEQALAASHDELHAELSVLQSLYQVEAEADRKVTVTLYENVIIRAEPGDVRGTAYGLAFDIGTTTVVGYLLDLSTGEELAVASRLNPQSALGHDVIARAEHASKGAGERGRLQSLIVDCMQEIAGACCEAAQVALDRCYEVALGGNTVMTHLLFGVNPHPITMAPFTPAWTRALTVKAREIGLQLHPESRIYALPAVAGYVGGDITAGLLATDLPSSDVLTLFVDIGTNGEIVLGNRDGWAACACAAGPAFEGARISCGMRALSGAIDIVTSDPSREDLSLHVLGGEAARGLCGTGLIDAIATLLRMGAIDEQGRLLEAAEALPAKLAARIRSEKKTGSEVLLVPKAETVEKRRDLTLTQRDIRELQLAKGAIRAGVDMLLKVRGVSSAQIEKVLIAGGFGNFIRPASALAIGLFSESFELKKLKFVGNTAGMGAKMCLLDEAARTRVEWIARQTEYVELSGRRDFQDIYMDAMLFPDSATLNVAPAMQPTGVCVE